MDVEGFCYFDSCKCESELSFLYSPPISMISGVNVVSPRSCMRTISLRSSTIIFSKLGPRANVFIDPPNFLEYSSAHLTVLRTNATYCPFHRQVRRGSPVRTRILSNSLTEVNGKKTALLCSLSRFPRQYLYHQGSFKALP